MKIDRGTKRVSERREREGGTEYVRVWVHVLACDGRTNIVVSFKVCILPSSSFWTLVARH